MPRRRLNAGDQSRQRRVAGVAWARALDSGLRRGLALRRAGVRAHLLGQTRGAGMERARRSRARGGGRSLGEVDFDATVHGRENWGWLRVPGAALSTVRRSDACLHGRSHDSDMAGGEELSGAVETAATWAKRARGLGGKEEELTAESERGSAGSGRSWQRGIDRRWLGCQRLKTRAKAAMQGLR